MEAAVGAAVGAEPGDEAGGILLLPSSIEFGLERVGDHLAAGAGRVGQLEPLVEEHLVVPPIDEREDRKSRTRLLEEAEELREAPEAYM